MFAKAGDGGPDGPRAWNARKIAAGVARREKEIRKAREGCKTLVEIFVSAYGNAPHDGCRFRAHKVQEARYAQRPVG